MRATVMYQAGDVRVENLAMWEAPHPASVQAETEWGEHVTDSEYRMPEGVEP